MKSKVAKIARKLQKLDSEQLKFIRCWLDELEGPRRKEAQKLMNSLMVGKVTDDEACKALHRIRGKGS